jgi:hypothetical protein
VPECDQVLRFAVGSADAARSRTWRLWVPRRKSDVYVAGRRLGNSVKVSLHEPGPARFALTREFLQETGYEAPADRDPRLAVEWDRPRPKPPSQIARPLAILVPWNEVLEREGAETGNVIWTPPPPEGTCVHFDVIYVPDGMPVTSHPGARSMGTQLVGELGLENGERVFVTALVRDIQAPLQAQIDKLRGARILDAEGNVIEETGMLGFGHEPNPDADDGTEVATLLDVTRPDER